MRSPPPCVPAAGPMISQTMYSAEPTSDAMREGGVPTYRTIEAATAALVAIASGPRRPAPRAMPAVETEPLATDYFGARDMLERAGVALRRRGARCAAATRPRWPPASSDSRWWSRRSGMLHKSDAGGVAVGIADAAELERVVADMEQRLAPEALSLERMAPLHEGVELIIGARRDSRFGPIAMVGLGGLYAEVLEDVAIGLAPLDQAGAVALLESLRGAAILHGARGRPPVDIAAAAAAAVALSRLAAARPDIAEIEVNPLLVTPARSVGTGRAHHPRGRIRACWLRAAFDGKVAIVTGGGSGMGRAMAREFARLGAAVVVAGRRPEPLAETVAQIDGGGRPCDGTADRRS